MLEKQSILKNLCILLSLSTIFFLAACIAHGAKEEKTAGLKSYAMSEAELQAQIMGIVDRFTAVMTSAFRQSDALLKTRKNRYELQAMVTYALYNAYIIAGEADPAIALLDMLSMVSLGRIILEEEGQKLYGVAVQPIIQGFRKAEKEIQKIAVEVLREDQLENVISTFRSWRNNNPEIIFFQFTRFNNIAGERRKAKPDDKEKPDGIFETVESATEKVEEVRLLAERGIYLATRLPQFWAAFGELGMSNLFENPDMKEALANLAQLSQGSTRLATAAEKLLDQIAVERKAVIKQAMESITRERKMAIDHFVTELSAERKAAIEDFLSEEQRIKGLLSDTRQTFETGREFILSADALMGQFNASGLSGKAMTFEITDYRMTLAELSNSARELTNLLTSVERFNANISFDQLIPQVITTIHMVEKQGKGPVDYIMRWLIILIVICFFGYITTKVLLRLVLTRSTT